MSSSRPAGVVAIVLGLLAVAAIPAAVAAAVVLPSLDVLPALFVSVPAAFVLGLLGLSAARRARYRVDRSVYRIGAGTARLGRFLVWAGHLPRDRGRPRPRLLRPPAREVVAGHRAAGPGARVCDHCAVFEIGNSLREARTRRQIELPLAEQATKIRVKYLRALEEERFEQLPSQTYVKGFLRTYADYLGLDGQLYVDEFNSRYVAGEDSDAAAAPLVGAPGAAYPKDGDEHRPDRRGAGRHRHARRRRGLADVRLGREGARGAQDGAGPPHGGDLTAPSPTSRSRL